MRGIKRSQNNKFKKPKRLPITPNILKEIKLNLFNSSYVFQDKVMIWAAMMVAFFGFMRGSEYTSDRANSFDQESTLCIEDIKLNKVININIKSSKTDPFRLGVTVRLAPNGSELCPVDALQKFLLNHPTNCGPLFTYTNGKYLTKRNISTMLKRFYPSHKSTISSHSFRIGAATTAAYMGYPRWLIQKLGRWTSDCFRSYIQIPDNTIHMVSRSLINQPDNNSVYDPDMA